MKRFAERLLSAAIESIFVITLESILSGTLFIALTRALTWSLQLNQTIAGSISLGIGVLAALVVLFTLLMIRRTRISIKVGRFDYKFEYKRLSINYRDRANPIYKRFYRVTALRDGVDRIVDSYAWTGDKVLKKTCTQDYRVEEIGHNGLYSMFEVRFPTPIKKKQTVEFEVKWQLDNSTGHARPFLATTITHDTKHIDFDLVLNHDQTQGSVYLKSSPHMQAQNAHETSRYDFDDGHLTIPVNGPLLFSYYEVKWSWIQ